MHASLTVLSSLPIDGSAQCLAARRMRALNTFVSFLLPPTRPWQKRHGSCCLSPSEVIRFFAFNIEVCPG